MALKILHAIPSLTGGGAERQLALLATEQCRNGVEVHVAHIGTGINLAPLMASNVNLHRIDARNAYDPKILWQMHRLVSVIRPDLIQSWLPQMDVLAGLVAHFTGTPHVLTERSSSLAYPPNWKNRLRRRMGFAACAIVANSEAGLAYWGNMGGTRVVIRNGIARPSCAEHAVTHATTGTNERIILFAGRLEAEKNLHSLIDALDQVMDSHPDCTALLFGEGRLHKTLSQQIVALDRQDRIHLPGYAADLSQWMRRAAVCVSVSLLEGHPNKVLEAMSVACPLIVSDIASHREILDGRSALICRAEDPSDIARALKQVLDHPEEARERAQRAAEVASLFSIERAAGEYLRLYDAILGRRIDFHPAT